jgi:hypothetical protein
MTTATLKKLCDQIPWCDSSVLSATVELGLEIARARWSRLLRCRLEIELKQIDW